MQLTQYPDRPGRIIADYGVNLLEESSSLHLQKGIPGIDEILTNDKVLLPVYVLCYNFVLYINCKLTRNNGKVRNFTYAGPSGWLIQPCRVILHVNP